MTLRSTVVDMGGSSCCVLRVRYNVLTIPPNMTGRRVHNVGSWSSHRGDDSTRNLSVLCVHPDWCVFGQWWQWAYTMTMIIILLLL